MNQQLPMNEEIAAIIPCYTASGDTTVIITTQGDRQLINTRIRTVINRLARSHCTDLVALKQKAMCATAHTLLQPLPIAPGLVLCPIKLRIPRIPGDTSTGYINFHAVRAIICAKQKPYQSIIKLTGGKELPALWQASTVKKHLQDARLVLAATASSAQMPLELSLISQKLTEAIYALLSVKSLHHTPDQNLITVLP